jgi:hypothetical protein
MTPNKTNENNTNAPMDPFSEIEELSANEKQELLMWWIGRNN